jgi:hypothetical protein
MRSREFLPSFFEPTEKMTTDRLFDVLRNYFHRFRDQLSKLNPQLRLDAFFELMGMSCARPSRNDPLPLASAAESNAEAVEAEAAEAEVLAEAEAAEAEAEAAESNAKAEAAEAAACLQGLSPFPLMSYKHVSVKTSVSY